MKLSRKLTPAVGVIAIPILATTVMLGSGHWGRHTETAGKPVVAQRSQPALSGEQRGRVLASLDALPLAFEANQGQMDPQVKYMARGNGYTVFLTPNDTVFALRSSSKSSPTNINRKFAANATGKTVRDRGKETAAAVYMKLMGANPQPQIVAGRELPGQTNYYTGNDPTKWQTGVKQYAGVSYREIYPGVDMAFHGQQRQLEFDFLVAPGASVAPIAMAFAGAKRLATDKSGNLVLSSAAGDVLLHKPVAYQERNGNRELVDAGFHVKNHKQVALALGPYDHSRQLVIDPSLSYAMFLGGSAEDEAFAVAVDSSGNAYVAGQMASPNFPAHAGTISTSGGFDAFVTRIGSGAAPDFTTLIGGTGDEAVLGVALNATGAYVVGNTSSSTFASTTNIGPQGGQDVFVAKLNTATGIAQYITRIGGSGTDSGNAIAIDSSGNAYIGGETTSSDFPTANPVQPSNGSGDTGFVAELNAAGSALTYSTYLGGTTGDLVTGIALDSSNNAYVTGVTVSSDFPTTSGVFQITQNGADDSFVTEVKSDGSAWVYSTLLGGSGSDDALGIAVDSAGEAYVAGQTNSTDFPTLNPAQSSNGGGYDVFVTKLNSDGTALLFSTYYGSSLDESGTGIALDTFGDAYVTGRTSSSGFPVPGSPFQGSLSGSSDAFVLELSNSGFTVYASFLGGTGNENSIAGNTTLAPIGGIAVDGNSNAYVVGETSSTTSFPVTSAFGCCGSYGGGLADGFVAKVGPAPADFSVAASPVTISTASGQTTAAITITVSSVNSSYGQAVTLSCASLPAKAACNFSSGSVTPGSSAQTSSLTISTNGSASAGLLAPMDRTTRLFAALFMPLLGLVVAGAGTRSRRKRLLGMASLALALAGVLVLPACGGGSSGGGGGGGGGNNTPPGTYNITVTGTAGASTHSAPVTLTVN